MINPIRNKEYLIKEVTDNTSPRVIFVMAIMGNLFTEKTKITKSLNKLRTYQSKLNQVKTEIAASFLIYKAHSRVYYNLVDTGMST